ncbi:MAG: SBBP repeat-containing protein [Saprospiraceae bacterium]|nr:SBBP repeat-containing protein [Saprospiraceae bacterium]
MNRNNKVFIVLSFFPYFFCQAQNINPELIWATYYGSSMNDFTQKILQDSERSLIVLSYIGGADAPTTQNIHQGSFGGIFDVMLTKFDVEGKLMWSTYFGGENSDFAPFFTLDHNNNIIVAGVTGSVNQITTPNAIQTELMGDVDGFIVKFNKDGQVLWSTYFGGSEDDRIENITVDSLGQIYVVGSTYSKDLHVTESCHQNINAGKSDGFIAKLTTDGQLLWSSYYGGDEDDVFYGLSLDKDQNLIVTGSTFSTNNIATEGSYDDSYNGSGDGFMVKLNSKGERIWGSYFGGTKLDNLYLVEFDEFQNFYLVGQTNSSNLGTNGSLSAGLNGKEDVILIKFNINQKKEWATYLGGSEWDDIFSISIETNGDLILSIRTASHDFPVTEYTFNEYHNGGESDGAFIKLDPNGKLIWSTFFGGNKHDRGTDMIFGLDGYLYGCLITNSQDLATSGAYQIVANEYDCFVFKMKDATIVNTKELEKWPALSVFPNPTTSHIQIPNPNLDKRNIIIYNAMGEMQRRYLFTAETDFDISSLPNGPYYLISENGNFKSVAKIIKID